MNARDQKIIDTALRLADKEGWEKITLEQIAKSTKIPATQIKKKFESTREILPLIVVSVTEKTFAACGKPDNKTPVHDRLFDILMARFDVLQRHRAAILSIVTASRKDPQTALILACAQLEAMKKIQNFSSVLKYKTYRIFTPYLLWMLFLAAFQIWKTDETIDMAKTMAALDRYLRYACRAAIILRVKQV
jgi:AcrR family transcriptional regulator